MIWISLQKIYQVPQKPKRSIKTVKLKRWQIWLENIYTWKIMVDIALQTKSGLSQQKPKKV